MIREHSALFCTEIQFVGFFGADIVLMAEKGGVINVGPPASGCAPPPHRMSCCVVPLRLPISR